MSLLFVLWWWYFDGAGAAGEQPVRTHADAVRFHIWSYAHFPLSLGIVVLGVGIERSVTAAAHVALGRLDVTIMTAAAAVIMGSMGCIAATAGSSKTAARGPRDLTFAAAAVSAVAGTLVPTSSPAVLIAALFVVFGSLLCVAENRKALSSGEHRLPTPARP